MYVTQVGVSLEEVQLTLQHCLRLTLWLIPLGILSAAAAGWAMAGRFLSPIRNITRAAQEIEVSQLDIFDRFYRADPSRSKEIRGVGLGLSLVKWIVEQHGGTTKVESQPNQGSRFSLILPED